VIDNVLLVFLQQPQLGKQNQRPMFAIEERACE
jgi:hypothetical protein